MRLPADAGFRLFALGLTAVSLAGCGVTGGGDRPASIADAAAQDGTGPGADYPMVLGEPFTVDGELYTPADTLNYDTVGYAAIDSGAGVTLAHRTLPLPSYVEVTALATGKTILARVERRGPMAGSSFVALSPAAAAELQAAEGAAVRVRRVNPPEVDRVELRSGRPASARMETPRSLVEVLRRKLPSSGSASLRAPIRARPASTAVAAPSAPAVASDTAPRPVAAVASSGAPQPVAAYPLRPLPSSASAQRTEPVPVAFRIGDNRSTAKPAPALKPASAALPAAPASGDGFVVQAGTFSVHANARRVAETLGGYVTPAGKFYRVRTGPFTSRGQAEAALAKVRAAGYSDARVYTAG